MKPKNKITREEILKIERRIRREEFVEERAYDGRLRPQIHKNKKKEKDKKKCRKRITDERD